MLGLGEHARILGPPELTTELRERVEVLIERHAGDRRDGRARLMPRSATSTAPSPAARDGGEPDGRTPDAAIRPERFARLVTLASILIDAGRAGRRLDAAKLCAT